MKLKSVVEGIGKRLGECFPDKLISVDNIPANADGNFFLNIIEQSANEGISARRSRAFRFDVVYFSAKDDKYAFLDWVDAMHNALREFAVEGQIVRAKNRNTHAEDMAYHFLFEVSAEYIEIDYDAENTMDNLEVGIEEKQ